MIYHKIHAWEEEEQIYCSWWSLGGRVETNKLEWEGRRGEIFSSCQGY